MSLAPYLIRIAIDLDCTIADYGWPDIGDPVRGALEVFTDLQAAGHEVVIWTIRANPAPVLAYLERWGIFPAFVNVDPAAPPGSIGGGLGLLVGHKLTYHYSIDDRNIGCPLCPGLSGRMVVDWQAVRVLLEGMGLLAPASFNFWGWDLGGEA